MSYRHHPVIEGLKINEDGSEIIYMGVKLATAKMNRTARRSDTVLVYFKRQTHSVARLVCEAWHGMGENIDCNATRIDNKLGFHYTNLYWAKKGTNPNIGEVVRKRSCKSKIKESDIRNIVKRLNAGEKLKTLAAEYGTSDMSISRIRKRYGKEQ